SSVKESVDSFLQSSQPASDPCTKSEGKKPRRHGSLALFFRKFYNLASMRLRDLCDRLELTRPDLRQIIWTCFEYSILHYTDMMKDRHVDQMIMCAIYITCKVTSADRNFQEIMKHYRNQPQAASHVYRSVLISKTSTGPVSADTGLRENGPLSLLVR
ncbi:UNVERIFIED_CONTAM: hypothetical protein GTU68_060145, partial [Idotea baltica]|nr:hypothetical protein [Idotea baltica]